MIGVPIISTRCFDVITNRKSFVETSKRFFGDESRNVGRGDREQTHTQGDTGCHGRGPEISLVPILANGGENESYKNRIKMFNRNYYTV